MAEKTELKLNIIEEGIKKDTIPVLGEVIKTVNDGVFAVKEQAIIGKQYIVLCPVCGKPVLAKVKEPIVIRVMHKTCNAPIIIKGVRERSTVTNLYVGGKTNAKLSWWSLTGRKQFKLRIGKNYIGRKDADNPSDLSFNDEYVSAKSFCIDVDKTARGFVFHLTIENATNPVRVNKIEQPIGSSFDLNYGDIIEFGYPPKPIRLTFEPVEK